MRFWDSSAIVPLVVPEPQSDWVRGLLRDDPVGISWVLSPVEVHSALARRRCEGALSPEDFAAARARTKSVFAALSSVVALEELAERALRVLDLPDLRSADALQLAAALLASRERPRDLSFVTLDARLAEAAEREGFPVEVPKPRS